MGARAPIGPLKVGAYAHGMLLSVRFMARLHGVTVVYVFVKLILRFVTYVLGAIA